MSDSEGAKILVVVSADGDCGSIVGMLTDAGYQAQPVVEPDLLQAIIQEAPPGCIIVPYGLRGPDGGTSLVESLKSDTIYGHLPMITTLPAAALRGIDWGDVQVDDFLLEPFERDTLLARVQICLARAQRDQDANPLTGLPGNLAIIREAESRLKKDTPFCVAYLDLDNFKPFNDKYGFLRGDEVLRMTARIVVNAVRALNRNDTHVGHVGGDDFIFILPPGVAQSTCDEVTKNFDLLIPNFYDVEDRIRGAIHSIDRQGDSRTFSLMTCSIAVVDTSLHPVKHIADISARAAQVKKLAKSVEGSNTYFDRRA
ncbi:MAG: diguanylate cyclase [Candidatus Hydrogenedentes bacterium]|nr:diguanylate cyclase [Candidatus Hydrogenedentota bacterium]